MLTCQWQRLSPDLGAGIPEEVREAGVGGEFERALEVSRGEYERLVDAGLAEQAPYALSLAYRIRYTLDLNAREAMHLIELRSGREGHPTYRAVAQAMHERIAAVHPGVAAAMTHVDTSAEPRLERIMSEIRTHRKRVGAGQRRVAGRLLALLALARAPPRGSSPLVEPTSGVVPAVLRLEFRGGFLARASARESLRPPPRPAVGRRGRCRATSRPK